MRDLHDNIRASVTLAPATRTASANGTSVDLAGFEAAEVVVATGTITDGTHTIELQDSDDGATFAAVADAFLLGSEPAIGAADDNKTFRVGYVGGKRYLRASVTVSGATSGGTYGAVVIAGYPRHAPVA